MATAPLYTGTVNGHPVRFYRKPTGALELPWHAADDLYRALGLNREARREILRVTQKSWAGELRTIATTDGVVTIAPHYAAQGIIGAVIETGGAPASVKTEYAMAGGEALKVMQGDLPPEAALAFALEAFRNTGGAA